MELGDCSETKCVLHGEGLACEDTAPGWLPALEKEHETVCELKTHFPALWDFPLSLFSAKQRIVANRCSFGPISQGIEINVMFEHVCFPTHCWSCAFPSSLQKAEHEQILLMPLLQSYGWSQCQRVFSERRGLCLRAWKAVPVTHLRHPPALWQDLSIQPLCTALFNSFRCQSPGSSAHPWHCCFHETLAHSPEPGVRMLAQHCPAFSLLLQCHHPPDCASCATVLGNIFTAVHLLPLGGFFSFPVLLLSVKVFFQPFLPQRVVGVFMDSLLCQFLR